MQGSPADTAEATPTLPADTLADTIRRQVLDPRMTTGSTHRTDLQISRSTRYVGYYLADFRASGSLDTAVGAKQARWRGRVWCRHDGSDRGVGAPPELEHPPGARTDQTHAPPAPLGEVLEVVPGDTAAPSIQPHEAMAGLKDFLTSG